VSKSHGIINLRNLVDRTLKMRVTEAGNMGSWGRGNFENDDAVDWIEALVDGDDTTAIESALHEVTTAAANDYVNSNESRRALAAAEIVAAARGFPADELPEWAIDWVATHDVPRGYETVTLALDAIQRIATDSELRVVTEEAQLMDVWIDVLDDLVRRLTT
jgi:Domain of unknown function (DUF4259)